MISTDDEMLPAQAAASATALREKRGATGAGPTTLRDASSLFLDRACCGGGGGFFGGLDGEGREEKRRRKWEREGAFFFSFPVRRRRREKEEEEAVDDDEEKEKTFCSVASSNNIPLSLSTPSKLSFSDSQPHRRGVK